MTPATAYAGRVAPALEGKIFFPADEGFGEARRAWNLSVDQRPATVVFPESAHDVAAAVLFAARHGCRVAAQGTGHNAAPLGPLGDTVLVKTERMRGIRIDSRRRAARVEAGVVWHEAVHAAAGHGLATLAGSSPDVGVAGYTLGGGMSFLGRKHGLASSHVRAIEMVTADGRLVRTDRDSEPELFWALRGGGGSFGVVTALEFGLLPIHEAYAGVLWYPIGRGAEVLHTWHELTKAGPPDELTTIGRFLQFPPIPDIPPDVRGKSFVVVEAIHLGDPREADALLAPLRSLRPVNDTIATVPVSALSHLHMDPDHPVPGIGDGLQLGELPGEAVDVLDDVAGAGGQFPLLSVELRHLGGEFGRARPENGALPAIDAQYVMYAVGMTPVPELLAPVRAQVEAVKTALAPWAAKQMYLNFAETQQPVSAFWSEQAYRRLRRVKAAVDPGDRIRANHPIPPAR
jgi:FAD binding domain/Berberine and berberine like